MSLLESSSKTIRFHYVCRGGCCKSLDDQAGRTSTHKAIFLQVKADYPEFKVGGSLKGIIVNCSDTKLLGLKDEVGKGSQGCTRERM